MFSYIDVDTMKSQKIFFSILGILNEYLPTRYSADSRGIVMVTDNLLRTSKWTCQITKNARKRHYRRV